MLVVAALACRDDRDAFTAPATDATLEAELVSPLRFRLLTAGYHHTCGIALDDRAWCWGWNEFGQLGDGTTTTSRRPTAVLTDRAFRQVSAGLVHTCGVDRDDRAWCWGGNHDGGAR